MKVKLKEIGEVITGCTPKTKVEQYYNKKDYMFIGPSDIKNTKYVTKSEKYISNDAYLDYKNRFISKDSIMIDCIGSDMGNVAITKESVLTNQQINSLTNIHVENYNVEYIYYILSTMKHFFHHIGTNGSTMPIINKTMFENIEIEVVNKEKQDKIAKILSDIDKKIDTNNQINDNLLKLNNQLYEEYFINNINENADEISLKDLIKVVNGYSYKGSELTDESDIGLATIKNFERKGGFKEDGFKPLNPQKIKEEQIVEKNDILVACTDLTQQADIIGNAVLLLGKAEYEKVIISMDLVKIIPKENIDKYVIFSILNSRGFKNFALGYKSGTTVLHLNKKCFDDFIIKLPANDKLDIFSKMVKTNYEKISNILKENRRLEKLRDTLLPKLMNGEIDIDKIEI